MGLTAFTAAVLATQVLFRWPASEDDVGASPDITSQAWPEGELQLVERSTAAAHSGAAGVLVRVSRGYDEAWHAQVTLRPFSPPDREHAFVLSFWARIDVEAGAVVTLVFQDADDVDGFAPIKQVDVPLSRFWSVYEVELAVPASRLGHAISTSIWVGHALGTMSFDGFELRASPLAPKPPGPPPPSSHSHHSSSSSSSRSSTPRSPGAVLRFGFDRAGDERAVSVGQAAAGQGSWTVAVAATSGDGGGGGGGLLLHVERAWAAAEGAWLDLPPHVRRRPLPMLLRVSLWARSDGCDAETAASALSLAFRDHNSTLGVRRLELSSGWQLHYAVIALSTRDDGLAVRPRLWCGALPEGHHHIDGIEYDEVPIDDGLGWLGDAPSRIRAARMGSFRVTFADEEGWPIDYGRAELTLLTHAFPFGAALASRQQALMTHEAYRWYLGAAEPLFWATTVAAMDGADAAPTDELLRWAEERAWQVEARLLEDSDADAAADRGWASGLACDAVANEARARIARGIEALAGRAARFHVLRGALHWPSALARCGEEALESVVHAAFRRAHQLAPEAQLVASEEGLLATRMLSDVEAYHAMLSRMVAADVPLHGVAVRAHFGVGPPSPDAEVDASSLKHRLDALATLRLPLHLTDVAVGGLDAAAHAYELEKVLRVAFSHPAVASISLGDLWDDGNHLHGSGLFAEDRQPKPAVAALERLWRDEWHSAASKATMTSDGSIDFEGFFGTYSYELHSGARVCSGTVDLRQLRTEEEARGGDGSGEARPVQIRLVRCRWPGHLHMPLWMSPVVVALVMIGCLLACFRKRGDNLAFADTYADKTKSKTRESGVELIE